MDVPEFVDEEALKDVFSSFIGLPNRVLKAIDLTKHAYSARQDGESYLTRHLYPVTKMVCEFFGDATTEEVIIAALLHDLLDNGTLTPERFKDAFGETAYAMAKPIAKPRLPGIEGVSDAERWSLANLQRFKQLSASSYEARVITLIKRIDNLYLAAGMDPVSLKLYLRETREFYMPLAEETCAELHSTIHRRVEELEERIPAN